ncbi:MAG: class I SAM-dependent RNA methyltransferase [Planctomycetes bacterium]|nr:class I SAM-dependent RNA methyltransferase [Planctomycetota bacterium]
MLPPKFQRPLPLGSRLEVEIESLAGSGDGVARVDGCVVFVPQSAPGDTLLVEIVEVQKRHARARLIEVRAPSGDRRTPHCGHFEHCGGCTWQHVSAEAQRAAKARHLTDALERLGGLKLETPIEVRFAEEYGYRSRATLSFTGRGGALGFRRARAHAVEAIRECPVLVPELQRELTRLQADQARIPSQAVEVQLAAGDERVCTTFVDARGHVCGVVEKDATVEQRVGDLHFTWDARQFFQGNRRLLETLVQTAVDGARGSTALDLYCGAGLFSLSLAKNFEQVLGVEGLSRSVDLARRNATVNNIKNVRFEARAVADALAHADFAHRVDFVLLDPPRAGAGAEVVRAIARREPREVRYVSCDPATLARDVALFRDEGYEVVSVVGLDLFPQTVHVEAVVRLRPSGST